MNLGYLCCLYTGDWIPTNCSSYTWIPISSFFCLASVHLWTPFPCISLSPPHPAPAWCFSYPFHFGYASFQFISATLLHPNHVISPISHHYWAACLLGCLCGPVIKWAFGRLRRKTASRGREDTRVWYRETMFSQMVSCDFLLDEPLHGYFL